MKLKTVTAVILAILCLFSLVSCGPTDTNQTTSPPEYTQPAKTGGVVEGKSVFNNIDYTLYIPSSYKVNENVPLLVALHGGGQGTMGDAKDNRQFFADYTGLNTAAEKYGFIVVYPRQSTLNNYTYDYWNWYIQQERESKEPKAIYNIVNEVKHSYSIDSSRVFICGISAGAAMAQVIAVTYTDVFSGCCSVAGITYKSGSIVSTNQLQAEGPSIENSVIINNISHYLGADKKVTKLLVVTGTADTRVNPKNSLVMAQTWAGVMKKLNSTVDTQLSSEALTGIDGVNYTKSVHATLNGEEICTLYEIDGMGHSWPGSNMGVSISITSGQDLGYKGGIDLNEVMCEFFGLNK